MKILKVKENIEDDTISCEDVFIVFVYLMQAMCFPHSSDSCFQASN